MDSQIILNKFIKRELKRFKTLQKNMLQRFETLPEGSITRVDEGQYSYVFRNGNKQIKIALGPKDNRLMEALKLRRQIKAALPLVNRKVKLLESFLKKDFIYDPLDIELPEQYLDINPALFLPSDVNPGEWAKASYQKGRFYKNDIKHYTEGGIVTRSKSEAMIGTELERRGLIFRYEPALRVGNETKYPDFVIIHPVTRRLIYWEHFGKVDDADYIKKNLRRMNLYSRNGIYLGINFVMTFETRDEPLTIKAINDKIDEILAMC